MASESIATYQQDLMKEMGTQNELLLKLPPLVPYSSVPASLVEVVMDGKKPTAKKTTGVYDQIAMIQKYATQALMIQSIEQTKQPDLDADADIPCSIVKLVWGNDTKPTPSTYPH